MAQATHSAHFMTASFVTPASPKRAGPANIVASRQLSAKKKTPVNTATKKVQVKLLKHIAGTGQAGQGAWNASGFRCLLSRFSLTLELLS
jgi:hypothetical protein